MKGFPTKHTKLEIPYRSIMHHSSCDILPPFPCHVLMTDAIHCYHDKTFDIISSYIATNAN